MAAVAAPAVAVEPVARALSVVIDAPAIPQSAAFSGLAVLAAGVALTLACYALYRKRVAVSTVEISGDAYTEGAHAV